MRIHYEELETSTWMSWVYLEWKNWHRAIYCTFDLPFDLRRDVRICREDQHHDSALRDPRKNSLSPIRPWRNVTRSNPAFLSRIFKRFAN